jgi:peptide-methionine (S)-S-oxide reductase
MARQEVATLAGGCFWCLEAVFLDLKGVSGVASGYSGGHVPRPTYEHVCSGTTGHAEVTQITFDPDVIGYRDLLDVFFTIHDPTTKDRQGNDVGTQYRSVIHCATPAHHVAATASRDRYAARLSAAGLGAITTEIVHPAPPFFYAEDAHQQYLAKHPGGYCGLGGTGVSCPVGTGA